MASSGLVTRLYLAETNTEGLPPKLCARETKIHEDLVKQNALIGYVLEHELSLLRPGIVSRAGRT